MHYTTERKTDKLSRHREHPLDYRVIELAREIQEKTADNYRGKNIFHRKILVGPQ